MEAGRRIGTITYSMRGPGRPAGSMAYVNGVAEAVLAARRSLAAMDWPLARQPANLALTITDLGPDRLGVTSSDGRVQVTIQDRLVDTGEDFFPRLKATVAHEYLHVCQYACWRDRADAHEPEYLWWMEACAIYFEHRISPRDRRTGKKLLTYEDALPDARGAHGRAGLESATAGSTLGYCYAPLAFLLAKGYGPEFLSHTWLRIAESKGDAPTAVEAIEATLGEYGESGSRAAFEHVFREYVLFMVSPESRWVRAQLGLDVLEAARLPAGPQALELPGWSFRVFEPARGQRLSARLEGDEGLRAYLVGADGARERIQRVEGDASLELARGESGRLVVVNATPRTRAARLTTGADALTAAYALANE